MDVVNHHYSIATKTWPYLFRQIKGLLFLVVAIDKNQLKGALLPQHSGKDIPETPLLERNP